MERRSLGIVAIILIGLMAVVATAGLDNLPRSLRKSIDASGWQLTSARATFDQNRAWLDGALRDEPVLFQNKAAAWRARLDQDHSKLDAATAKLTALRQLGKANRRNDAPQVERTLGEFQSLEQEPVRDAAALRAEAERWLNYKRELPQRLEAMRASYDALQAFDPAAATTVVAKAMIDWPDKRQDLESRLAGLKELPAQGRQIWESTAPLRASALENKLSDADYAALFSAADRLDTDARQAKDGAASLDALAGQLYVSWDKLLLEIDEGRDAREKVRIVRTRFPDATLAHGETSSEERWEPLESARRRDADHGLGMVIERKPAGKYDSEAERTVQPPAYAYIAPPGQSNAYGAWSGGVWHWLPEYLILSHLLHTWRTPVTVPDYDAYQSARRRGEVFYGRQDEFRPRTFPRAAPSAGTSSPSSGGGWWKERAAPRQPSWGDRGFAGSKYQSRGGFSGSRFQSRGGGGFRSFSRGGGGFRSFSRGGRR